MDTVARERMRTGTTGEEAAAPAHQEAPRAVRVGAMRAGPDFTAASAVVGRLLSALAARSAGWWPASQLREAVSRYTVEDDRYYHAHFAHLRGDNGFLSFDDVRAAYVIGHLAAFNHEYGGRGWDRVEQDLAPVWSEIAGDTWGDVRELARDAYRRASSADYQLWRGQLAE